MEFISKNWYIYDLNYSIISYKKNNFKNNILKDFKKRFDVDTRLLF